MKLFYKHTQTEDTMLKKNILFTLLLSTVVFATGCKDELEMPLTPETGGEGTVPVTFAIGIADEQDGYNQGESSVARTMDNPANASQGLDARVVPDPVSRATGLKPQQVYNLQIIQFSQDGQKLAATSATSYTIGSPITLSWNTSNTDCQLLFIAAGNGGSVSKYPSGSLNTLADYQQMISNVDFGSLPTDETSLTDVDKQPYVLFLPHVKVENSTIQSPGIINGTGHDVRILLKRLAAKLTLKWNFNEVANQGYTLKEVRLSQVSGTIPNGSPNHAKGRFYFYPARESNDTYPTAEKEYVDYFRLKDTELSDTKGSYSIWMPANVRGTSAKVTAPQHRNKDNAPEGACFVEFVAEKTKKGTSEIEDRLTYRIYLGGAAVNDFNIKENTNYTWDVTMNSTNVADPRITRLDMTPVTSKVQKNTSNCFMVIPGTDFYFNPYKHEAGTKGWNDELVNSPSSDSPTKKTEITSVKVLWQSRDNGTSGELVLGRYISENNHTNLINYEELSDINKAKVYVKVPVSKGGNAVIAAYAADGTTILWSWHLWITDYVPERMKVDGGDVDARYKAAQSGTKNGTVHKYLSTIWWEEGKTYTNMVMMDRDLGAKKGGYPGLGKGTYYQVYTAMDGVNREGLLYQWGRKDPFFGSADGTTTEINVIYNGDGTPLSLTKTDQYASKDNSIKNPLTFYHTDYSIGTSWNGNNATAPGKKTIYDPSPEGWKVPMNGTTPSPQDLLNNGTGIFAKFGAITGNRLNDNSELNITLADNNSYFTNARYYSQTQFFKNETTISNPKAANPKGGRIYFLADGISEKSDNWTIKNTMWIPASAERYYQGGDLNVPSFGHLWLADNRTGNNGKTSALFGIIPTITQLCFFYPAYGWSVRCIQDNGNP